MKLLLIRHGQSEADLLNVHEGRADFALTQRGHMQAEAMARHVKANFDVHRIYASPLRRARQTAEYLSKEAGVAVETDEKLMEFNNGLIAGLERPVADAKYPYVPDLPVHAAVYEQESSLEFRFRVEYMLSKIISENPGNVVVAVIAHGGTINQFYRSLLKLPVDSDIVFATGDTGIHLWDISSKRRLVRLSNYLGHLQGI